MDGVKEGKRPMVNILKHYLCDCGEKNMKKKCTFYLVSLSTEKFTDPSIYPRNQKDLKLIYKIKLK